MINHGMINHDMSPNVTMLKWNIFDEFGGFSWQNMVVYHDKSWHIMINHDISPSNSER